MRMSKISYIVSDQVLLLTLLSISRPTPTGAASSLLQFLVVVQCVGGRRSIVTRTYRLLDWPVKN